MSIHGAIFMYKNKSADGKNNLCGKKVSEYRLQMAEKTSQRKLADLMQMEGIDIDKNAVQRIESGQRFVTDIELKALVKVLGVHYEDLLGE